MAESVEKLVDMSEAARQTGLTQSTVWRMARDGKIPSYQPARRKLVYVSDVAAAIKASKKEGTPK